MTGFRIYAHRNRSANFLRSADIPDVQPKWQLIRVTTRLAIGPNEEFVRVQVYAFELRNRKDVDALYESVKEMSAEIVDLPDEYYEDY